MIIHNCIHTCSAVFHGKRNFLCKKAFQDQLPDINKQKLIDSKQQLTPIQKPGWNFQDFLPVVTYSFQIMWWAVKLANIFGKSSGKSSRIMYLFLSFYSLIFACIWYSSLIYSSWCICLEICLKTSWILKPEKQLSDFCPGYCLSETSWRFM